MDISVAEISSIIKQQIADGTARIVRKSTLPDYYD